MKNSKNKAIEKMRKGTMRDIVHPKDRGVIFHASGSHVGPRASSVTGEGNRLKIYKK